MKYIAAIAAALLLGGCTIYSRSSVSQHFTSADDSSTIKTSATSSQAMDGTKQTEIKPAEPSGQVEED